MPTRKSRKARKDDLIQLRVSAAQKKLLTTAAERAGLDLSTWLRAVALREAAGFDAVVTNPPWPTGRETILDPQLGSGAFLARAAAAMPSGFFMLPLSAGALVPQLVRLLNSAGAQMEQQPEQQHQKSEKPKKNPE